MCNASCRKSAHTKCTCSCKGKYHGTERENLFQVFDNRAELLQQAQQRPITAGCSECANNECCDCLEVAV
jgi:hypothetical protein